jgi:hypothetical protein
MRSIFLGSTHIMTILKFVTTGDATVVWRRICTSGHVVHVQCIGQARNEENNPFSNSRGFQGKNPIKCQIPTLTTNTNAYSKIKSLSISLVWFQHILPIVIQSFRSYPHLIHPVESIHPSKSRMFSQKSANSLEEGRGWYHKWQRDNVLSKSTWKKFEQYGNVNNSDCALWNYEMLLRSRFEPYFNDRR